jgi:hypothetical protein
VPTEALSWLTPALPGVNCFGKQGSFFSFLRVEEAEPPTGGIAFSVSDFRSNADWEKVSNFGGVTSKPRVETKMDIAMKIGSGGQSYVHLIFEP